MLEVIIAALVGIAVGVVAAYLAANRRYTALRITAEATATSLRHTVADLKGKTELVASLQAENRHLNALSLSQENEISLLKEQSAAEARLRQEQFQEQLNVVREGMRMVVTGEGGARGTGWRGGEGVPVRVSGKTGTAEVGAGERKRKNAWFIAYAPSDAPTAAIALVVEKMPDPIKHGRVKGHLQSQVGQRGLACFRICPGYHFEAGVSNCLSHGL